MGKYRVWASIGASKFIGVFEADSEDEAIDKACEEGDTYVSLCHKCAREVDIGEIVDFEAEEE